MGAVGDHVDLNTAPVARNALVVAKVAVAALPASGAYHVRVIARSSANGTGYGLNFLIDPAGNVDAFVYQSVMGTETNLATSTGVLNVGPGGRVAMSLRATGDSPTQLCGKVWRAALPDPDPCTVTAGDATPELAAPGRSYVATYINGLPAATITVDAFRYYRVGPQ